MNRQLAARPGVIAALWATVALQYGCATVPFGSNDIEATDIASGQRELRDVVFFPQTAHHCGPAALTTVLQHGGVNTSPALLAKNIYIPRRQAAYRQKSLPPLADMSALLTALRANWIICCGKSPPDAQC